MSRWGRDDDRDPKGARDASPDGDNPSRNPERDYLAAAKQFRYREQYEEFLVKEWGLERDSKEWEKAQRDWELKEHLQDQERQPKRGVEDPDAREREARERRDALKAMREANTREDFAKYLAKTLKLSTDEPRYEELMLAWAVYKRQKEGF